ncbi:MAG: translation initiation factor IF-2 [Algoriphagus sp.]|jgi:translation initiation factor IF-2
MAVNKVMRLSQVARKLNMSLTHVVEALAQEGHKTDSNPNAKLSSDLLLILQEKFDSTELLGSDKPTEDTKTNSAAGDEILYFREEPVKTKPEPAPVEKIKIESKLEGTKVVGKIDLNKKPKPEPAPVVKEESVEKVVEPVEKVAEPVEKVAEPIKEEKVIPKPVVPEVIPEVVAEKVTPPTPPVVEKPAEPVIAETPNLAEEVKKAATVEKPEPIAEKPTPTIEKASPTILPPLIEEVKEVVAENTIIKAKGNKLAGLKVLGKIELPVEKKPESSQDKKKRKRKHVSRMGKLTGITDQKFFKNKENENKTSTGSTARPNDRKTTTPPPNRGGKRGPIRKEVVKEVDVKDSIKQTLARMQSRGPDFGAKQRRVKRKTRAERAELDEAIEQHESTYLKVTEFISAAELASLMDVTVNEVIGTCMEMGMFVSINQRLDAESIQMIALEYDFEIEFISAEEEIQAEALEIIDAAETLKSRAPIVTIMGHVDHGKTSLLDYIRTTKVATGEAGGITQHIGAYNVVISDGENKGKSLTFLDTPGHEAFTAMRARGAKVTDVVIIVISADDSIMPQTKEAINHAQNAGVSIVFAFNKMDKAGANPDKIRQDLSAQNILVESWGGKYQEQEISAKTGKGIEELMDKVILESELLELKANPDRNANGTVIEATLDKGRGYVATILVESGTLKVGDIILAGQYFGRVRAMIDDLGERIDVAGPSTPVQILGLPGAPQAGDKFNVMETDREAREIANKREQIIREQSIRAKRHITLDEIGRRKAIGSFKELNVIVKGDVDGSVEALSDSLLKLSTEEVQVKIIHKGVGQISESDVLLASAADAIILGFQVRPSGNARKIADTEEIEIRLYSVIYAAIDELKDAMEGLLAPTEKEVITGNIEVREIFKISKVGTIAGSYVTDGFVKRANNVRIIRDGIVLHEGSIDQLKRYKDDMSEVKKGYECGIKITKFNDLQTGDIIESYEIQEIKRKLK